MLYERKGGLIVGTVLADRYVIDGLLGRGAMGEVYAAIDRTLGRPVALKVPPFEQRGHGRATDRFLRGARAVAQVEHPHVVRVYDCGVDGEHGAYLVMERPRGQSLAEALQRSERFAVALAVEIARKLTAAAAALHGCGVVHRDIKPANVLISIDARGEPDVKLLDFGLARLLFETQTLTRPGEVLGTLTYLSPERLRGGGQVSAAADVYALGCVLYELLTGAPPFRARTRSELRLSICADPPRSVEELCSEAPSDLVHAVMSALAKDPNARPTAGELETMLGLAAGRALAPGTFWKSATPGFRTVSRFQVERCIGAGVHGEVYAAVDTQEQRRVALKRLRRCSPDGLYRLKHEFRAVSDLHHPNLARHYELHVDESEAFVVIELIEGVPFDEHVGGSWSLLLQATVQICAGLAALHDAGLAHRDLKPAHVLVDAGGAVKLIDFSMLAEELGRQLRATPSPSPPDDMLALGEMLEHSLRRVDTLEGHDALRLPETIAQRAAFARLLSRDPGERPTARGLLELLRAPAPLGARELPATGAPERTRSRVPHAIMVGRARELAVLRRAIAAPAEQLALYAITGASGVGKSALLESALRDLPEKAWVCATRCRPLEAIPYAAIDGALDGLCGYLSGGHDALLDAVMPRGLASLLKLFPVFGRIHRMQRAAKLEPAAPPDPVQAESQAYEALRELLTALGRRGPLALVLDDAHWIDARSAALLSHVLRAPDAPRLALIVVRRSDEEAGELDRLLAGLATRTVVLPIDPFSTREVAELLEQLWPDREVSSELAARVHARTHGHPLFIRTLAAQQALESDVLLDLGAALRARVDALPEACRTLLHAVCVCRIPLPPAIYRAAFPDTRDALDRLLREQLVQHAVRGREGVLEPVHAALREAALAGLNADAQRALHGRLAAVLSADSHAEALVTHLAQSGNRLAAVRLAEDLAGDAERLHAFERAAMFYRIVLDFTAERAERLPLVLRHAEALRQAGEAYQAALRLAEAAELSAPEPAIVLRRRAGELLLRCGDIERGASLLSSALERAGLKLATNAEETLVGVGSAYERLRARGLSFERRAERDVPRAEIEHLELLLGVAEGMSHVDLRGLPFAFEALRFALDIGEPHRLQRAAAIFVWDTGSHLPTELVEPVLAMCQTLALELGTPYGHALCHAARSEYLHFAADFLGAEVECERAELLLLDHCVGASRELSSVRVASAFIQYAQKGDYRRRVPQTLRWLADAHRTHDLFQVNMLRSACSLVWVAHDQPERARTELREAGAAWPEGAGVFQIGVALFLDVVDRYEGDGTAHLHPAQGWQSVLSSPAAATPFLQGYVCLHQAWGAIRCLALRPDDEAAHQLATTAIATLRKLALPIWTQVAEAFEANFEHLRGAQARALELLQRSELGFRGLHMLCWAACARRRRGELTGGMLGQRLAQEAEAELRDLGIVRPDKWCKAYFSMYEATTAGTPTLIEESF